MYAKLCNVKWNKGKIYKGTNIDGTFIYFKVVDISNDKLIIKIIRDYDKTTCFDDDALIEYSMNYEYRSYNPDNFLFNSKELKDKELYMMLAKVL
jgi:hypothetical protein